MTIHPEDGAIKEKEYLEGYDARKRNLCTLEEARQRSGKFAQGWLAADVDETKRVFNGYGQVVPPPPQQYRNGLGTAALVLGIIGLAFAAWLWTWWLGGVLSVLGLVFGLVGRGRAKRGEANNKGMATAGVVTSSIGLALAVLGFSLFLSWVNEVDETISDIPTEDEIIEDWGDSLDDIQTDGYLNCLDSIPLDMSTSRFEQEMIACEDVWLGD